MPTCACVVCTYTHIHVCACHHVCISVSSCVFVCVLYMFICMSVCGTVCSQCALECMDVRTCVCACVCVRKPSDMHVCMLLASFALLHLHSVTGR